LFVLVIGLIVNAMLDYNRNELRWCVEEQVAPLSAMCEAIALSPMRPTREEVEEMNRTAGASIVVGIKDTHYAARLLKHYLDAGVNINAQDSRAARRGTALHDAAWSRDEAAVGLLLANGADPTKVDALGETPADVAREWQRRDPKSDYAGVITLLDPSKR
jgi:hypothetical protein